MVRSTATAEDSQHGDHNGFGVQRLERVRCIAATIGFDVFWLFVGEKLVGRNFNVTFLESKSSRLAHDSSLPFAHSYDQRNLSRCAGLKLPMHCAVAIATAANSDASFRLAVANTHDLTGLFVTSGYSGKASGRFFGGFPLELIRNSLLNSPFKKGSRRIFSVFFHVFF